MPNSQDIHINHKRKRNLDYLNHKEGKRILTIKPKNNGKGIFSGILSIPMQWIREADIDLNEPQNIIAECKNGKIIIEKNNK